MGNNSKLKSINGLDGQSKVFVFTLYGVAISTLVITPNTNFDPVNVVKLLVVSIVGMASLITVSVSFFQSKKRDFFAISIFFGLLLMMFFSFALIDSPLSQEIYGNYGRNTGLLAYLALLGVGFIGVFVKSEIVLKRVFCLLLFTGFLNAVYASIQFLELDPIPWASSYNPLMGTLGNPNFLSAFLGISASSAIVGNLILKSPLSKTLSLIYVFTCIFLTWKSESWQGTAIILISFTLVVIVLAHNRFRNRVLTMSLMATTVAGGLLALFGLIGRGLLGSFLEKGTLAIRIQYWRTAISSIQDNWLLGSGIDSFGDNFRLYRDQSALDQLGPNVFTNSAHNVYLDFAISFGVIPLALLLLLKMVIFVSAIKRIRNCNYSLDYFFAIFIAWLAYEVQALISINQLGLGSWGWLLTGLVYGCTRNRAKLEEIEKEESSRRAPVNRNFEYGAILWFLGATAGLLLALPSFRADANFRSSLDSQRIEVILEASRAFPVDPNRLNYIIPLIDKAGLNTQAVSLVEFGVSEFPKNYNLHRLRASLDGVDEASKRLSIQKLAILNPLVDGR